MTRRDTTSTIRKLEGVANERRQAGDMRAVSAINEAIRGLSDFRADHDRIFRMVDPG